MNQDRIQDIIQDIRKYRYMYTRKDISRHLRAAGHTPMDIEAAWRTLDNKNPPANASTTNTPAEPASSSKNSSKGLDPIQFIRSYRHRYTREAINGHLRVAGHSLKDIEAAWNTVETGTNT